MTTLAERLRLSMKAAGLNQAELERAAGLTVGFMSRPLSGRRHSMAADRSARIAQVLGVAVEWLATGNGPSGRDDLGPPVVEAPTGRVADNSSRGAPEAARPVVAVDPEGQRRFGHALAEAFRRGAFELEDLDAIRSLLQNAGALLRDASDLVDAAEAWMRAAASLRQERRPVTIETLAYRMYSQGVARAEQGMRDRSEALNDEADRQLRSLGAEVPAKPVVELKRKRGRPRKSAA